MPGASNTHRTRDREREGDGGRERERERTMKTRTNPKNRGGRKGEETDRQSEKTDETIEIEEG